jgi:alpha-L-rhamnosidase
VKAFFAKWLQDLRDAQRPDGQFPMVAPLKVAEDDGGPGWAEAGVLVPWSMYRRSGDLEFLTANYPAAKRYIEFELGRCRPGPLPPEKYHCFGDWLNVEEETPHDVIYLAYLYRALNTGALMAYELGETTDEATFRQQAQEVQASFISHYTGDEGQIAGDSQTAYAVATVDGLLDKSTSLGHLKRKLLGNDGKLRTGFLGTRDLMNALEEAPEVAYQLLLNRDYPGWLFSISHGATSIWERWNGWTPQGGFGDPSMNSFSHYAFGAVAEWMFRNLAGFASLDPLVIRPVPSPELSSAQAAIEVPQGEIRTRWEMSETRLFLEVEIPPNLMASVDLSRVSTPEAVPPATRVGPGKHNFEIVARS